MHAMSWHRRAWLTSICSAAVAIGFGYPVSAGNQASVGLEDMATLLRGDVRIVWMGDSFCTSYSSRVPGASLNTWPIDRISSIEGGAARNHGIIYAAKRCDPLHLVQSIDPDGYTVERNASKPLFFGLPVRGIQEVCTTKDLVLGTNDQVLEFRLLNERLEPGLHGVFSETEDLVRMRFLFRSASNHAEQLPSAILRDHDGPSTSLDLAGHSRGFLHLGDLPTEGRPPAPGQINAALPDIDVLNDLDLTIRVPLSIDPSLVGTNQYLDAAGAIYYQVNEQGSRLPGMYYSYIADDSWSYRGFGDDLACNATHDKVFTGEQLTHWLDVTTLDPGQPVLFAWYLAPESIGYTTARQSMERMIDLTDAAASDIGLPDVHHLLIISHMIAYSGDNGHALIAAQKQAAFDIATDRTNVAAASIYTATDGILFDGNPVALQWLLEHGFDDFEFGALQADLTAEPIAGRLLDGALLHPAGSEGGAFFATILGDLIREAGCPADFSPDGLINIQDLLLVLSHWNESGEMDLDGDGLINIGELLAVLDAWGECWPVQAPFAATH